MARKYSPVHIYLDNSAWGDLAFEEKVEGFQVTDRHRQAMKRSRFYPVLSGLNYGEVAALFLKKEKKHRERGKRLLALMKDMTFPRVFEWKSILKHDYLRALGGKKRSYFLSERIMKTLIKAFDDPSAFRPVWQNATVNYKEIKERYKRVISRMGEQLREKQGGIERPQSLTAESFEHYYGILQKPKILVYWLKNSGIPATEENATKLLTHFKSSRVFTAFLKHFTALLLEQSSVYSKVEENDAVDVMHYAMSGYSKFFLSDDRRLRRLLGRIPDPGPRVRSLPEFIQQEL